MRSGLLTAATGPDIGHARTTETLAANRSARAKAVVSAADDDGAPSVPATITSFVSEVRLPRHTATGHDAWVATVSVVEPNINAPAAVTSELLTTTIRAPP